MNVDMYESIVKAAMDKGLVADVEKVAEEKRPSPWPVNLGSAALGAAGLLGAGGLAAAIGKYNEALAAAKKGKETIKGYQDIEKQKKSLENMIKSLKTKTTGAGKAVRGAKTVTARTAAKNLSELAKQHPLAAAGAGVGAGVAGSAVLGGKRNQHPVIYKY